MASLIKKVVGGDPQAVERFYRLYSPKISKYLSYKLPQEEAEEILNDTFIEAIDTMSFLSEEEKVEPWLYRIAHNKMVDFYRKKKIKTTLMSQIHFLDIVAKEILEPEFQFEKNRMKEKIEKTFYQLSERHQKILRLHYEENIPVKEIALSFNMSYKATESLLFRARQQFKLTYERS
jgi:RNA polymerase sigma-70 factor (ECF subfamily)